MNKYFTAISFSLLTLFSAQQAFADCDEMENQSDEWTELSMQMASAYEQNNLDEALTAAKRLTLICNRSPVVNYTMSEIYRKMGDEQESYNYVKRATEYMLDYPVPQALTEKIWMRRAEFDLPYKKQLEELQYQLDTGTGEVGSRIKQTDDELAGVNAQLATLQDANLELLQSQMDLLYTTKWIGAGTAIGGLVLASIGAGVLGASYSKASDKYGQNWKDFDKKDALVHGGIATLATGIGLGLAGTAVALFSHIKLIKLKAANANILDTGAESDNSEVTAASGVDVNLGVSLNSLVLDLTF